MAVKLETLEERKEREYCIGTRHALVSANLPSASAVALVATKAARPASLIAS
jgi:hypothetical protein